MKLISLSFSKQILYIAVSLIVQKHFKKSVFSFLATDVVTVYVFHEPSLLSSLQDKDLTGVVLKSLVVKDVCITSSLIILLIGQSC